MALQAILPTVGLGRINLYAVNVNSSTPTNAVFVLVLFSTGDTAANLRDFDDLAAVLAGASVESAFTNYARIVLDEGDVAAPIVDDGADEQTWELADLTPAIASAGNGSNEDIDQVGIFYDPDSTGGTDADIIPLHFTNDDAAAALTTTNGSDLDITSPSPTWAAVDAS